MESKTVWDSGFHTVDSGFQILDSRFFVSGSCRMDSRDCNHYLIPDSLSCIPISKTQDSPFHKQQFPGFWIPQAKLSWIPESRFPQMGIHKSAQCFFRLLNILFVFCIIHWVHFQQRGEVWLTLPWQHYYWMTTKPKTTAKARRTANNNMFILNNNNLTTLHVHHAILYLSQPSLHDHDIKLPNFTRPLYEEVEHDTKIFFFQTQILSSRINPRKFHQHLTN